MKFNLTIFLGLLLGVAVSLAQPAGTAAPEAGGGEAGAWVEVPRDSLDTAALTSRGIRLLDMPGFDWKHAQTEHFVVHFEQAIFARKIARMAEFFYAYISQDLTGMEDQAEGRSHIFVFRNARRWQDMRRTLPDVPEWTFSRCSSYLPPGAMSAE